jgi:arylsulfatase
LALSTSAKAAKKPNILVLWGDDVGVWNTSACKRGGMGYKTPDIDSIADAGALFTDMYAQQSGTASRGPFILGQQPFRAGGSLIVSSICHGAIERQKALGSLKTLMDMSARN